MNRDDIIRMAREAGLEVDGEYFSDDIYRAVLVRFFHMAQAAMIEQGWRQCAKGQQTTQFCGMVEQAVQAEREACAKLCEDLDFSDWRDRGWDQGTYDCAAAIRAREQA